MGTGRRVRRGQGGVTLVELVISIVVIAIAVSGVIPLISNTIRHSADPMILHQAVAIAVKNVSGRRRWSKLREWMGGQA